MNRKAFMPCWYKRPLVGSLPVTILMMLSND
eukprot:CAMPEP_0197889680 /NCGR_PEP_ID=MMETSP1439-20131203/24468_1 /TAXON_ID=66791 /ORGANISM="Gonyaulax spinifera, Strain CCMP409" /LENGTH=30 /DNA_ID= /DNA_START= /DNA_END= /DNA_ORIENTATION=